MAVLSVITSLALTIAVAGAPNQVPHSVPAEPIKVVSTSHEVHFPGDVVFRLEAESSATITRITLFYRLAGRNIKVYGYPEFTPDTSVSAEFKLKTSGTGYLPSGVDIEYYYVITDADGNTIETDRLSLEYKDPRFSWRELRRGDLIVVYHDIPSSKVEAAAARVSDRLEAVKELFGVESVTPMKAVIVNGLREAESVFPFISETAGRAHVFGGFAYDSYNLFLLAGLWEDGMVHELAHLLLDQAVDSPRARIPAWLNEGLAMYFELNSRRQPTVERAARSGSLLRLRYMKTVPGKPRDVHLFYAQARSVVKYIIDTHGPDRMTSLLRTINGGTRLGDAIREVYGVSLDELEAQWKAQFAEATPLAPRPDPGTIGTSVLISGAIVLALSLTFVGWVTRRARRREPEDGALTT